MSIQYSSSFHIALITLEVSHGFTVSPQQHRSSTAEVRKTKLRAEIANGRLARALVNSFRGHQISRWFTYKKREQMVKFHSKLWNCQWLPYQKVQVHLKVAPTFEA